MNKLLSGSSLSTGWFCPGLDASLFELKIIIKEGVQQARMMLLKLPINCEWRRGGREAILWYHSEIHMYFPLFSAYQELMVSSEMIGFCQNRNWWDPFYSNDYAEKSTRGKGKCWKSSRSAEIVVSIHHGHHTITKTSSHTDLPQVTETKKEQSLTQWHSLWMKMWKKQSKEGKKIICAVQKGIQEWRNRAFIQLILPSK